MRSASAGASFSIQTIALPEAVVTYWRLRLAACWMMIWAARSGSIVGILSMLAPIVSSNRAVRMAPRQTAVTLTPLPRSSARRVSIKPCSACLELL